VEDYVHWVANDIICLGLIMAGKRGVPCPLKGNRVLSSGLTHQPFCLVLILAQVRSVHWKIPQWETYHNFGNYLIILIKIGFFLLFQVSRASKNMKKYATVRYDVLDSIRTVFSNKKHQFHPLFSK